MSERERLNIGSALANTIFLLNCLRHKFDANNESDAEIRFAIDALIKDLEELYINE